MHAEERLPGTASMLTNWPESQTTRTEAPGLLAQRPAVADARTLCPLRRLGRNRRDRGPDRARLRQRDPTVTILSSEPAHDGAPARSAIRAGRTGAKVADRMVKCSAGLASS